MSKTKYPELASYEWLYTKYIVEKLSSVKIGKLVGCGPGTVVCALQRRVIPTRSCRSAASKSHRGFESSYLNDKEWLKRKYIDEKLTSYEVAKEASTNQHSVMRALKYHKISTRTHIEATKNRKTFWRKYDILEDKSWLSEQYITEKKTLKDIAEEIGSTQTNVVRALEKFKIKRRTNSEAQKLVEHKSDYAILNDESFLKWQYSTLGKSTLVIADENGIKCCNSVRQALLRNKIKVRNVREGQIHNRRTDFFIENKEVIDGGLTGDASLKRYNRESDLSAPIFIRANKDYEHVLWVAKQLFAEKAYKRVGPINKGIFKGKRHIYPGFRTLSHDILMPYFKRWYPEINPYGGISCY